MPGFAPSTRLATHEVSNQPAEFGGINLFDIDLALKEAALRIGLVHDVFPVQSFSLLSRRRCVKSARGWRRRCARSAPRPGRSGCSSSVNKPIGTRRSLPLSTATAGALTRCASTPLGTS